LEAKTALGETFGTKKQKANIRAQERNKIDVGAMEGVMGYVMDSIEKGSGNLLTEGTFHSIFIREFINSLFLQKNARKRLIRTD